MLNILLSSCFSRSVLTDYSIDRKIYKIETSDEKIIEFEKGYYATLSDDEIIQISSTGERKVYQKSDVKRIYWEYERVRVYKIEMINDEIIEFPNNDIAYLLLNEVVITKSEGKKIKYQLSEIKNIYTSQFDGTKTLGLIVLTPLVTVLGIFLFLKIIGRGPGGAVP